MATTTIPVYFEVGTKKVFACSLEWPGWARWGKTEEAAIEKLIEVAPRYAEVARRAHKRFPRIEPERLEVVERLPGNGTTDFGAPARVAEADYARLDGAKAARLRDLLQAAWEFLDEVAAEAPPTLRKGPRGGGRDRDQVLQHVLGAQNAYARTIGVRIKEPDFGDRRAIDQFREAVLEKIVPGGGKPEKGWPVPYFVRRDAWHVLDHAWEIQDKSEL
jgi:hypothetical protein